MSLAHSSVADTASNGGTNAERAYEIMPSLVGSEMCIRDSLQGALLPRQLGPDRRVHGRIEIHQPPVSYTHLTLPTKA